MVCFAGSWEENSRTIKAVGKKKKLPFLFNVSEALRTRCSWRYIQPRKGYITMIRDRNEYLKRTHEVHIPQDIQKQMAYSSKQQQKEIDTAGI